MKTVNGVQKEKQNIKNGWQDKLRHPKYVI